MAAADTVVAIATAPGRGAIGVVKVSGPGVGAIMLAITGRILAPRRADVVAFREATGEAIDQGIALFYPGPGSYTGEDVLELQGHGGPAVLRALVKRCLDLGARVAEPGEFTRRAFLNDKLDLAQAEAVADLIDASTEQAARSAVRSLQGEFSRLVTAVQSKLTDLRVLIEALLDFPEEEIDTLHRSKMGGQLEQLRAHVEEMLQSARQGSLLRDGVAVALIGPPNSGKSTLINRLSGDSVAIVSPIPGTTRDLIKQSVELQGVPVHIIDTAGLREAGDPIEAIGIARTWEAIAMADLAVIVLDVGTEASEFLQAIASKLPARLPVVYAHNKIDLIDDAIRSEVIAGSEHVWISARSGSGVDRLVDSILGRAGWSSAGETVFLARARHIYALQECAARLAAAGPELDRLEIVAEELRLAQLAMSQITGEFVADDLLGEIFSRFCIGK